MRSIEPCHRRLVVREPEDIGMVRRTVTAMVDGAGDRPTADRLAAELAAELAAGPGGGFVLARPLARAGGLELLAVTQGPGSGSVRLGEHARRALNQRSAGGTGAAAACAVWSYSGSGAAVLARVGNASARPVRESWAGGVSIAAVEGDPCGDAWALAETDDSAAVFVVDGLGHGAGAERAATAAVDAFLEEPAAHPEAVLRRVHEAMVGTRGGVAAVCRIDRDRREVVFAGVGNIAGRLFAGGGSRTLLSSSGSMGTQLAFPRPRVETAPWGSGSVLVFASDGVRSDINLAVRPGLLTCHPALSAAIFLRDLHKGNDDATVVVVRCDRMEEP